MRIDNDGPLITGTDYFASDVARKLSAVYVSINAACVRLLVPDPAMVDAAGANYVIISRGKSPRDGWRDMLELLWEDGSDTPYIADVGAESVDRMPAAKDDGRTDLRCIGYGPTLAVLWDLPARYRHVKRLPCRKPWSE